MITDSFNALLLGPTDNFIIEGYNHKYLICQRQCTFINTPSYLFMLECHENVVKMIFKELFFICVQV